MRTWTCAEVPVLNPIDLHKCFVADRLNFRKKETSAAFNLPAKNRLIFFNKLNNLIGTLKHTFYVILGGICRT